MPDVTQEPRLLKMTMSLEQEQPPHGENFIRTIQLPPKVLTVWDAGQMESNSPTVMSAKSETVQNQKGTKPVANAHNWKPVQS